MELEELRSLIERLTGYEYYSKGYLNSEGRKVFERVVRIVLKKRPELKSMITRVRRNPSYDNVIKFINIIVELFTIRHG